MSNLSLCLFLFLCISFFLFFFLEVSVLPWKSKWQIPFCFPPFFRRLTNWPTGQPIDQLTNWPTNWPSNGPPDEPMDLLPNQWTCQLANQHTNQPNGFFSSSNNHQMHISSLSKLISYQKVTYVWEDFDRQNQSKAQQQSSKSTKQSPKSDKKHFWVLIWVPNLFSICRLGQEMSLETSVSRPNPTKQHAYLDFGSMHHPTLLFMFWNVFQRAYTRQDKTRQDKTKKTQNCYQILNPSKMVEK